MWLLDSVLAADASIEEQIGHILDRLPDSVSLWESLTGNYNRDLFCGILISQQSIWHFAVIERDQKNRGSWTRRSHRSDGRK